MNITISFDATNGFSVSLGGSHLPATKRPGKGKSIIAFPSEYCMVDVETTGLSPEWNDIIEIGAIRYMDGVEVDRFQSLVQPPISEDGLYIDSFIEELTGITNAMLADAPLPDDVLLLFLDFLQNDIILGYNTSFDVNFLYDSCARHLKKALSNDYMDVMRLARKLCPDLPHHRLKDMAAHYSIDQWQAHRTICDCEVTEQVYRRLLSDGMAKYGSEEAIAQAFKHHGPACHGGVRAADIIGDESKVQPDCPIYQQHCCITGKLDRFTRAEAMQLIADLGGINDNSVTKTTNFLILGNNDYCATIKGGKSTKQKKAEGAKLKGQDIEIIPENVFYDMIAEYVSESEA